MHKEQLTYFIHAYEQGSFAHAARLIPLTPQGANKAIRSLENELGRRLSTEDTLKPAPYADALYEFATTTQVRFDELMHEFAAIDASRSNIIRIGLSAGVLDILGASLFRKFEKQHPETSFFIEEVIDLRCDENLLSDFYDLAFTIAPYSEEFETIEVCSMPLSMWVNAKKPLSKVEMVSISDLEKHTLATPLNGAKNTRRIGELCEKREITTKKIVHLQQMYRIYEFVQQNKGIGTNVGILLESKLFSDESVVSIPFEDFSFDFGISWTKKHQLSEIEQVFIDYVISQQKSFPID